MGPSPFGDGPPSSYHWVLKGAVVRWPGEGGGSSKVDRREHGAGLYGTLARWSDARADAYRGSDWEHSGSSRFPAHHEIVATA